jgi:photosystem II stability/assembly factor-like uncharacterized protein
VRRLVPFGLLAVLTPLTAAGLGYALAQAPQTQNARPAHNIEASHGHRVSTTVLPDHGTFEPSGVTFIDTQKGWVLGQDGCLSCAALRVTDDGGSSWAPLPALPVPLGFDHPTPTSITNVYFANGRDGYLFGPGLETTDDGGHTWRHQALPPVLQLTGGDGYVYAVAQRAFSDSFTLWSEVAGSKAWTQRVLPPTEAPATFTTQPAPQLAVEGTTLLLLWPGFTGPQGFGAPLSLGSIWMSTDGGSSWVRRSDPCTASDDGAAVATIALGHPSDWLVDCFDDEQSQQAQVTQHHLYGTADDGATWVRLADPSHTGGPGLMADNGSGHAFLTTNGDSDEMDASFDGAEHWATLFSSGGSFSGWSGLQFVNASIGFVVAPSPSTPSHLYRTTDGGVTWSVLDVTTSS